MTQRSTKETFFDRNFVVVRSSVRNQKQTNERLMKACFVFPNAEDIVQVSAVCNGTDDVDRATGTQIK